MFYAWACQGNSCKIILCWFIFLLVPQTTSLEDGHWLGFVSHFALFSCSCFSFRLALTGHRPLPPCPLLVSPDHLPCLRLLNSIFHRQDKRHLFPSSRERERERGGTYPPSSIRCSSCSEAAGSKVDRRRKSSFVHLDFYRLLFSAAFVGRHSGCGEAECPF